MSSNKSLIQKADLALGDLATAGQLNPEQSDRFFRQIIDSPTLLSQCRVVGMNSPVMHIDKIGFGSRTLQAAPSDAPGTYLSTRAKPDLSQVVLTAKEVMAEVNIPYDVMEDNIERATTAGALQQAPGGLHQTIVDLLGQRAAIDLEELAIQGDTSNGGDAYLALVDGWLKSITSNVVDVSGDFTKDVQKSAIKAMPPRFLQNRGALKTYVSVNNETELRDILGNRVGALGDAHITGALPLMVFGSEVKGAAKMPGASGIFTNPNNLIFGLHRNVMLEYTKDIRARMFVIVLTARIAVAVEEQLAAVKLTNITNG